MQASVLPTIRCKRDTTQQEGYVFNNMIARTSFLMVYLPTVETCVEMVLANHYMNQNDKLESSIFLACSVIVLKVFGYALKQRKKQKIVRFINKRQ